MIQNLSNTKKDLQKMPPVDTQTDVVVRIQELKSEIRKEQEEYAKIFKELKAMQANQMSSEQLYEMWRDIEENEDPELIEDIKLENQAREHELRRKPDSQHTFRTVEISAKPQKLLSDLTTTRLDVEEIIGCGKVINLNMGNTSSIQQTQQANLGPSPLLSSLLKSTSSNSPAGQPVVPPPIGANSARASAPTITTLLTSGSIPNTNQPAITLKSTIPHNEAVHLLTRPISGPPIESGSNSSSSTQSLISPSQSAPTLSMLLEKNKVITSSSNNQGITEHSKDVKTEEKVIATNSDSNNEEVPMDIEEDIATNNTSIVSHTNLPADIEEPDPNEEQQLLEVFKNIGNIDELDLDVAAVIDSTEVDFLKAVDDESQNADTNVLNFDTNVDEKNIVTSPAQQSEEKIGENKTTTKLEQPEKSSDENLVAGTVQKAEEPNDKKKTSQDAQPHNSKPETLSSDDSNDNIPLAAVASLENKERNHNVDVTQDNSFLKEVESAIKHKVTNTDSSVPEAVSATENEKQTEIIANQNMASPKITPTTTIKENNSNDLQKGVSESEISDVIIIPTDDDESNGEVRTQLKASGLVSIKKQASQNEQSEDDKKPDELHEIVEGKASTANESNGKTIPSVPQEKTATEIEVTSAQSTTISIADTDEDSSTTDISIPPIRKEEKTTTLSKITAQQHAKQHHADATRNMQKSEDDCPVMSMSLTTPARPPVLRKLRDRDRSESPMIDDDITMHSDHSIHQRSRRRYSSTPVIDSIPNSPASSERDDRETRASKKQLLSIYNALQHNKNAMIMQRALNEDHTPKYNEVCLRPLDMPTIKKSIETGAIRSVGELQRDIMLMCQNALMLLSENTKSYKAANSFMQECQLIREFISNPNSGEAAAIAAAPPEKESKETKSNSVAYHASNVKVRGSARKSQRMS